MIPGPYSVCRFELVSDDGDALAYFTLRYGYDSVKQARAALPTLAREAGVPEEELCVVRAFGPDEEE